MLLSSRFIEPILPDCPGLNRQNVGIMHVVRWHGLHYYSDQARYINFYAHVGYFKCRIILKWRVKEGLKYCNTN